MVFNLETGTVSATNLRANFWLHTQLRVPDRDPLRRQVVAIEKVFRHENGVAAMRHFR